MTYDLNMKKTGFNCFRILFAKKKEALRWKC